MVRYFSDVEIGEEIGPLKRVVNRSDVVAFSNIWRNEESLAGPTFFTDSEEAQREGLPGVIVPGPMSMAFLAQLLTTWAEGGWVRKLDVVFRQTVPHDTPLQIVGIVTDKYEAEGEGCVECDLYLEKEDGDRLVGGQAILVLPFGSERT